jgi:hypothetical protein
VGRADAVATGGAYLKRLISHDALRLDGSQFFRSSDIGVVHVEMLWFMFLALYELQFSVEFSAEFCVCASASICCRVLVRDGES